MSERRDYAAFSIPRRDEAADRSKAAPVQKPSAKVDLFASAEFAEIEYDYSFNSAAPAAPAQTIASRPIDPVREKFFDMRGLAPGELVARRDSALFYRQAKYMEDFTDDYGGHAQFFMYYPRYQLMGYEQLRTYFTWRTKVRQGEMPPTSLSYIFLYIYELLCGIGVSSPVQGLEKLMAVWNAFRQDERTLDRYLPTWLKDYHIYYELPHSFEEFLNEHDLRGFYPDVLPFDPDADELDSLALWNGVSGYDITKSKFFCDGNDGLMRDCFYAVLSGLRELCADRGRRLFDFLAEEAKRSVEWHPFVQALFHPWLNQDNRIVEMSGLDVYSCINNRWTAHTHQLYWARRELVGYLIKRTEACLRAATQYKFKITANHNAFQPALQRFAALGISLNDLDAAIDMAVARFHMSLTRTVVTVNRENLERIRIEAKGTQDKLIVPEDDPIDQQASMPAKQYEPPAMDIDGWDALWEALSLTEREALATALRGGDMKAFALESDVMPEVLADSINEKAFDYIGDSIIEMSESVAIYDEYKQNVAKLVG